MLPVLSPSKHTNVSFLLSQSQIFPKRTLPLKPFNELTEKQASLLKNINIDKKSVENGEYAEIQEKLMEQYNYAKDYLKEKYPSYELELCDQEQKKYNDSISAFSFIDKNNDNKTYIVYLYKDNFNYYAVDNFWGHLIEDEFAELISKKLNKFNSIKKVTANITGLNGYICVYGTLCRHA